MIAQDGRTALQIAGVGLALESDRALEVTEAFLPFLWEGKADYTVTLRETEKLPYGELPDRVREDDIGYFGAGFEKRRFYGEADEAYAVAVTELKEKRVTVHYLARGAGRVSTTANVFYHIGWENLLLEEGRIVLHASLVETPYGGILFSGRSGVGKSTQAGLWERYGDAEQLNGDRAILDRGDAGWRGCGSPYAGSSRCWKNRETGLRAMVFLGQAQECSIRRLRPGEAFRRAYPGVTVNSGDSARALRVQALTEQLVTELPCYALDCTPTREAVELLKNELMKG